MLKENELTIREMRQMVKMTQHEFADYFEIPFRTLQNWESEKDKTNNRCCPGYLLKLIEYKLKKENMMGE